MSDTAAKGDGAESEPIGQREAGVASLVTCIRLSEQGIRQREKPNSTEDRTSAQHGRAHGAELG
jgi:hypothetical protein